MAVDGHTLCVSQVRAFIRRPPRLCRTVNDSVVDVTNTVTVRLVSDWLGAHSECGSSCLCGTRSWR